MCNVFLNKRQNYNENKIGLLFLRNTVKFALSGVYRNCPTNRWVPNLSVYDKLLNQIIKHKTYQLTTNTRRINYERHKAKMGQLGKKYQFLELVLNTYLSRRSKQWHILTKCEWKTSFDKILNSKITKHNKKTLANHNQ